MDAADESRDHSVLDDPPSPRGGLGGDGDVEGDGDGLDGRHAHKRKRQTLSCLQCKKRKTKCDKSRPCSTCIARNEASACVYEDGATPPPAVTYVPLEEFLELKDRLLRLERATAAPSYTSSPRALSHTGPIVPPFPETTPARTTSHHVLALSNTGTSTGGAVSRGDRRAAEVDQAFFAIEILAVPGDPMGAIRGHNLPSVSAPDDSPQGKLAESGQWPDITVPVQSVTNKSARWARDMADLLMAIPEETTLRRLLDFFFAEMAVSRYHIHQSVFLQELRQFESLRSGINRLTIDPGWLSMLCSVLWVSSHTLLDERPDSPYLVGFHRQTLLSLTSQLFEALEMSLGCAHWLFKPQMRVLHALLVGMPLHGRGPYAHFYSGMDMGVTRCMWFDVVVGICKSLNLHYLGTSTSPRPLPIDPMLPRHLPVYSREIAARAFHVALYLDTFTFCKFGGNTMPVPFCFPIGSFDTAEPLNFRDDDMLQPNPRPRPMTEPTGIIWEIFKSQIAKHWREIMEALVRPDEYTYEKAMVLDQELRRSHDKLLSLKAYSDLDELGDISFILSNSSYMQRLIRLHRPFYIRSFQDKRYEYSRTTALYAARQIALGHRKLVKMGCKPVVRDALYIFVHHLSATIVMFLQGLYDPSAREEMKEEMRISFDVCFQAAGHGKPVFDRVGEKGYRAISAMLKALDEPAPDISDVGLLFKEIEAQAQTPNPIPVGLGGERTIGEFMPVASSSSSAASASVPVAYPIPNASTIANGTLSGSATVNGFSNGSGNVGGYSTGNADGTSMSTGSNAGSLNSNGIDPGTGAWSSGLFKLSTDPTTAWTMPVAVGDEFSASASDPTSWDFNWDALIQGF